jgi:hypothetical protein
MQLSRSLLLAGNIGVWITTAWEIGSGKFL